MIRFVVPIGSNSFYYSAIYASKWIDGLVEIASRPGIGRVNIVVNDMWNVFRKPIPSKIYWIDTPLYYEDLYNSVPLQKYRFEEIWVPSNFNMEKCRKYFGNKCVYQPRPIHPLYFSAIIPNEKKYDMCFIGSCWWRKYCREFNDVCRRLKLRCMITGRYNALRLYDLIREFAKCKTLWWITGAEGYGLPLHEAQILGVVPICIDAHATKEFCVSPFKVGPAETRIVNDVSGRHKIWVPDWNEVLEVIKNAISDYYIYSSDIAMYEYEFIQKTIWSFIDRISKYT